MLQQTNTEPCKPLKTSTSGSMREDVRCRRKEMVQLKLLKRRSPSCECCRVQYFGRRLKVMHALTSNGIVLECCKHYLIGQ